MQLPLRIRRPHRDPGTGQGPEQWIIPDDSGNPMTRHGIGSDQRIQNHVVVGSAMGKAPARVREENQGRGSERQFAADLDHPVDTKSEGCLLTDATDAGARRCTGVTAEGEACRAPSEWVLTNGYCLRHSPDPKDRALAMAASLRGGLTTKARMKRGLDDGELGELCTPVDAQRWCEVVARAVATGRLSSTQGQTTVRAVAEWLRSRDLHVRETRLTTLEKRLAAMTTGGNGHQ